MTRLLSRLSVRTKLFAVSLIVIVIALLAIGGYSYDRRQMAVDFLTQQMLSQAQTQAEGQLAARANAEATQANDFLKSAQTDVVETAAYAGQLLDKVGVLGQGTYWDAATTLKPLAAHQLDNPNDEPGSVLVPSRSPLTDSLAKELNAVKYLDFAVPGFLTANPEVVSMYFVAPSGATLYYPNIDLAAVVGDYDPTLRPYYTNALPQNDPERKAIWSEPYQDSTGKGLVVTVSQPVYDSQGNFRGIVAADVQLALVSQQVSSAKVGDTGYVFVTDSMGRVIGMPERGYADFELKPESVATSQSPQQTVLNKGVPELQDATDKMRRGGTGVTVFKTADGVDHYIAYTKVQVSNYSLGVVVPVSETNSQAIAAIGQLAEETRLSAVISVGLLTIMTAVAAGVMYFVARSLTRPLAQLTTTAKQIVGGNLEAVAPVTTQDEIGALAATFNSMTGQLRDVINSLETRGELRTAQIQVSADVGRAAASILDADKLLDQTMHLITDRFGFYYAAAFTLDASGKWAVLREASGPGNVAEALKQSAHQLELDGNSMVAAALRSRRPRIALDVGEEAVRFANPLLPETRSEVALPLLVGDEVLGALDVQSVQAAAFDEASTTTLQAMADQIAVALNNARQYRREQLRAQQTTSLMEATLELATLTEGGDVSSRVLELMTTLLNASGAALWTPVEQTHQLEMVQANSAELGTLVGQRIRDNQGVVGDAYTTNYAAHLSGDQVRQETWVSQLAARVHAVLAAPLKWRDQIVGVVTVIHTADKIFTDDDANAAQLFAAQAAAALENARLIAQVQTTLKELSAANKRLTGEAWQTHLRGESVAREYRRTSRTTTAAAGATLQIPVELRGQPIGVVTLEDNQPQRELTDDERSIVESVVQQMALALESARLFEQTQSALNEARRLAQREQLINRVTSQLRSAISVDEVLRIATTEMRQALRATYTAAELTPPEASDNGQGHDHDSK